MKRGQWEWASRGWDAASAAFTSGENGLTIEVEQEQAMDSYNATASTCITLTPEVARDLLDWLRSVA